MQNRFFTHTFQMLVLYVSLLTVVFGDKCLCPIRTTKVGPVFITRNIKNVSDILHGPANIPCCVDGYKDRVQWFFRSSEKLTTETPMNNNDRDSKCPVLFIEKVKKENQGFYKCVASSSTGNTFNQTIKFDVLCPVSSSVTNVVATSKTTFDEWQKAHFCFEADIIEEGFSYYILWRFPNNESQKGYIKLKVKYTSVNVNNNFNIMINVTDSKSTVCGTSKHIKSCITINSIEVSEAGNYSCTVFTTSLREPQHIFQITLKERKKQIWIYICSGFLSSVFFWLIVMLFWFFFYDFQLLLLTIQLCCKRKNRKAIKDISYSDESAISTDRLNYIAIFYDDDSTEAEMFGLHLDNALNKRDISTYLFYRDKRHGRPSDEEIAEAVENCSLAICICLLDSVKNEEFVMAVQHSNKFNKTILLYYPGRRDIIRNVELIEDKRTRESCRELLTANKEIKSNYWNLWYYQMNTNGYCCCCCPHRLLTWIIIHHYRFIQKNC